MKNYQKQMLLFVNLFVGLLLALPELGRAAPLFQASEATLHIINESDQTICYVYISPVTDSTWGTDWLGENVIPPRETHIFNLSSNEYDIRLEDCDENILREDHNLAISGSYELHFIGMDSCDSLNKEGVSLLNQSLYSEALQKLQNALTCYQEAGDRPGEGQTLNNIAAVYDFQGSYDDALTTFEETLAISRELGNRAGEGITLNNIGHVYDSQGRYDEALTTYEEALAVLREVGNLAVEGITLNNIAAVYDSQRRYDEALTTYEEALAILREVGDRAMEGTTLNNIAGAYQSQGRYAEALTQYVATLAILREMGDRVGEGKTLNNIATVYQSQGRYAEALTTYEEALSIRHEVGDRPGEGQTLNNIARVYDSQGRYDEALTTYEEALAILREMGDRVGEGITLNNIATVYQSQGRYAEALTTYEEALAIRREVDDRAGEGKTLNNIGAIYDSQGRYAEALTSLEAALTISREVGDRAGEGSILNNIAGVYRSQGRQALAQYEAALAIHREVGDRAGEGETLVNIALVYHSQGRYAEALTTLEAAKAVLREVGNRPGEGAALVGIAAIYASQGRYVEALTTYEEALAIHREVGNRPGEGTALVGIAAVYTSQGRYVEALTTYEAVLAIRREVGDRAGEGLTLNGIAGIYEAQREYEEALNTYEEALAISREVGNRANESETLNDIAGVYRAQGRYAEALTAYEEALDIIHDHDAGRWINEGIVLNNIGFVYQVQGRYAEALVYYQQAIVVFEALRALAGHDEARASFIAQYTSLYHRALDLYVQENQLKEAFLVSEQGRARSFGDALGTGNVQLSDNEAAPLIAAEQTTYNEMVAAQDALARARSLNPPDPELVTDLEEQLAAAETAHAAALSAIAARSDQLAALVPGRQAVLSLQGVQTLLDTQSTLVSFWVLDERTIAFILASDSFDVVPIDATEETLNTQVKAFHDFPETDSAHPATAISLYDTLITPIRTYLNTPHLIIVPHQALHYIPFAALTDGERYLMDDFVITYLPNASMLQFLPDSDELPVYDTALILGNPAAGSTDEFDVSLTNLSAAEQSAQMIASLFGATPLLADEATETAVRDNISNANILQLGAHSRFNTVAPMQSAIYLTPGDDETDVRDDGRLHVDEVYGLPLDNIELVVLSACETNLGYLDRDNPLTNISPGDEVVSLNRAFLFQSPTVISTLWTVDDAATGLLMEHFYTYLLDGKSKADALRLAQLDVRAEYPNPYFWAGFVLSGDGGEINTTLIKSLAETYDTPTTPTRTTVSAEEEHSIFILEPTGPKGIRNAGIFIGSAVLIIVVVLIVVTRKKRQQGPR